MISRCIQTFAVFTLLVLSACGQKSLSILDEISGVWRANDSTLVTFIYEDKRMRMLIGEDAAPVTLGAIDDKNHTVNLNLTLKNGKAGVWTVRQLWNTDKTSFNLQITLDDGTQDQLAFIRKISVDDLNKIANAEARSRPVNGSSIATAAAQPQQPPVNAAPVLPPVTEPTAAAATPVAAVPPLPTAIPTPGVTEQNSAFAPSFDCMKASTGPERLICSNRELAEADVKLAQAYKAAANASTDKDALRAAQSKWRQSERDACSDVKCMLRAYNERLNQLR